MQSQRGTAAVCPESQAHARSHAPRTAAAPWPASCQVNELERTRLDGIPRAPTGALSFRHLASPDTRLIDVAMITTPRGNDSHACRSAVRRICLD